MKTHLKMFLREHLLSSLQVWLFVLSTDFINRFLTTLVHFPNEHYRAYFAFLYDRAISFLMYPYGRSCIFV